MLSPHWPAFLPLVQPTRELNRRFLSSALDLMLAMAKEKEPTGTNGSLLEVRTAINRESTAQANYLTMSILIVIKASALAVLC